MDFVYCPRRIASPFNYAASNGCTSACHSPEIGKNPPCFQELGTLN